MRYFILFLISLLDMIENLLTISITKNNISDIIYLDSDVYINSKDGDSKVDTIFVTRPHTVYTIKLDSDDFISLSDDHKIYTMDGWIKTKDLKNYHKIIIGQSIHNVVSIRKTRMKRKMIDFSVESRNYYANNILVHNCVRSDTMVMVKIDDKEFEIPIYKLHYKYKKHFSIFDFVEFQILKFMHFLYRFQ